MWHLPEWLQNSTFSWLISEDSVKQKVAFEGEHCNSLYIVGSQQRYLKKNTFKPAPPHRGAVPCAGKSPRFLVTGLKMSVPRWCKVWLFVLFSFYVKGKSLRVYFDPGHDMPIPQSLLCTKVHKMKIKCLAPAWQKPFLCRMVAAAKVNKWMDSNHSLVDETVQLKHRHLHGVISLNCQWAPLDTTSVQIDFSIDFGWSW